MDPAVGAAAVAEWEMARRAVLEVPLPSALAGSILCLEPQFRDGCWFPERVWGHEHNVKPELDLWERGAMDGAGRQFQTACWFLSVGAEA